MADIRSGGSDDSSMSSKDNSKINESLENSENQEKENGNLSELPQMCANTLSSRLKPMDNKQNKSAEIEGGSSCKSTSVLRPSQLNGHVGSNQKPSFLLNPSRLNPFATIQNDVINNGEQKESVKSECNSNTPKFLPLLQNGSKSETNVNTITSTPSTSAVVQSKDFVFGQNIHDRVVSDSKTEEAKPANCTNANGTSDMLFSSVLKETPVSNNESASSARLQGTKSLSESAREYEESRAVKRKYDEVEVITGEEDEINVVQICCKLFAYDKNSGGSWQERGRGTLRLNDLEATQNSHSRLVFRTAGSFRVVLNTKIWPEMTVQRASDRSIRLTAFDSSGEIKVFLVTGTPEDIQKLQKHLEVRVNKGNGDTEAVLEGIQIEVANVGAVNRENSKK